MDRKKGFYNLSEFAILRLSDNTSIMKHFLIEMIIIVAFLLGLRKDLCEYFTFLNILILLTNLMYQLLKMMQFVNVYVLVSKKRVVNSSYNIRIKVSGNYGYSFFVKRKDVNKFKNLSLREKYKMLDILEGFESEQCSREDRAFMERI